MKYFSVFSILLTLALMVAPIQVSAQSYSCPWNSTQVRAKFVGFKPWQQTLNLRQGDGFEVGAFHNNTGQYASDTYIVVRSIAGGLTYTVKNGQRFYPTNSGEWQISAFTKNAYGSNCTETIKIQVEELNRRESCSYGSTQARVQKNLQQPWVEHLTIRRGESVNVGSFHDNTGRFASDTLLLLRRINPDGSKTLLELMNNAETKTFDQAGEYLIRVRTMNQQAPGCQDNARVTVI